VDLRRHHAPFEQKPAGRRAGHHHGIDPMERRAFGRVQTPRLR
jgi:hypothetical protein